MDIIDEFCIQGIRQNGASAFEIANFTLTIQECCNWKVLAEHAL